MTNNGLSPAQKLDAAHLLHPYSHLSHLAEEGAVIIERGEGCFVYDENGRRYLEAMSGLWCTSLGFSEPRLVEAARKQMEKLPYYQCFGARSHRPGLELAARLAELAPGGLGRVLFANSGSEANDAAVKLAWYYNNALGRPKKKKILSRLGSYHGVTVASGSLTGQERVRQDFDLPIHNIIHVDFPSHYHKAGLEESPELFGQRMTDNLEKRILAEGPETVAAFIAEPIISGSGIITPPPGYFERVQEILGKYDILFIVDEVICGFGRTGRMFGSETYGLLPDMMSLAKGLSSAYIPISALLISEPVYEALKSQSDRLGGFFHGTTYAAHPVAAAVALEVLDIYRERNLVKMVHALSPYFFERLKTLAKNPLVGEIRGEGLLAGIEIAQNRKLRRSFDSALAVPAWIQKFALSEGLIVRASGQAVAICPPLIITREEIDLLVELLEKVLTAALEHFGPVDESRE